MGLRQKSGFLVYRVPSAVTTFQLTLPELAERLTRQPEPNFVPALFLCAACRSHMALGRIFLYDMH